MRITRVEPIILRLPQVTEACDGTQDDLLFKIGTDEGSTAEVRWILRRKSEVRWLKRPLRRLSRTGSRRCCWARTL
jgi:hypothetical protein